MVVSPPAANITSMMCMFVCVHAGGSRGHFEIDGRIQDDVHYKGRWEAQVCSAYLKVHPVICERGGGGCECVVCVCEYICPPVCVSPVDGSTLWLPLSSC